MGIVKNFFLNVNAFETGQFFRFNKDHKYTNMLGGVCTVFLIIAVLVLLIIKVVAVFKTPTVFVSATTHFQFDQVNSILTPSNEENPFLVAYQVVKTAGSQNITSFKSSLLVYSHNLSNHYTFLQECTPQHWAAAPSFYQQIQKAKSSNALLYCLPSGFSHSMNISQGSTFSINIGYRCGSNCSSIGKVQFLVRPIILDTLLNPQEREEYLVKFLEKRVYYRVSSTTSGIDTVLNYEVSKYKVETDTSVLPFERIDEDQGVFIPAQPASTSASNNFPTFIFFRTIFMLTNQEYHYFRSFSKLFDAIATIGGLLPIFLVLFIWLNYYALYQFQMVFLRRMHSDYQTKEYGVCFFISTLFYVMCSSVGIKLQSWEKTKEFHTKHRKVSQFLDILYLHKRLEFIERALSVIFQDHQLQALHLMRNKTFDEATAHLHRYSMKENLSHFLRVSKIKEAKRKARIDSRPSIILEPHVEPYGGITSSGTHKNLVISKQFEGEVREEDWPPKSSEVLAASLPPLKMEKKETNVEQIVKREEESEQLDEETIQQQMEDLRNAFCSFERIRQEAENSESGYFNQVSRNIMKSLNEQDWELIGNLEAFINSGEKQQIMQVIRDFLINQTFREDDQIFKKPINEIKQSYLFNEFSQKNMQKSQILRNRMSKHEEDGEREKDQKEIKEQKLRKQFLMRKGTL